MNIFETVTDDVQDDKKKKKPITINGTEFEEETPQTQAASINPSEFQEETAQNSNVSTKRRQIQKQDSKPLSFEEQQKIYETADVNSKEFKDVDAFWKQKMQPDDYDRASRRKIGKWTDEDETKYRVGKENQFLEDTRRIRQARREGATLSPEDVKKEEEINKVRAERRQARMQSYQDESGKEQEAPTDQFKKGYNVTGELREGLFGGYENSRLQDVGINPNVSAPETDKVGEYNTVKGFSGKALIDANRLRGNFGGATREAAARTYSEFVGFDKEETEGLIGAYKEVFGEEQLFVNRQNGKPVDDVEDLIDSGNFIPEGDKDFIEYSDPDARIAKLGLLARLDKAQNGSIDSKRVAQLWKNYQDATKEQREADEKLFEERKEALRKGDERSLSELVGDAFDAMFGGKNEESIDIDKTLLKVLGKEGQQIPTVNGAYTEDWKKLQEIGKTFVALENQQSRVKAQSIIGEIMKIPDTRWMFPILNPIQDTAVEKYLPTTGKVIQTATQLPLVLNPVGMAVAIGSHSEQLADNDPTSYNVLLGTSILTMGAGRALNAMRPQLGSAVVGGSQLGLGVGQSGVNYAINWKGYQNPDGTTNWGNVLQDLFIDVAMTGFDFAEAPMAGKILQNKFNPEPTKAINMIVENSETGKVGMLVQHPESGILQFREVDPSKVEAWKTMQEEAGNQYVYQKIDSKVYDNLISKNGVQSIVDSFKNLLYGTTDYEKVRSDALIKNKRFDVKSDLGKSILDSEGNVQKIQSDARVAKRVSDLPANEDRAYSVFQILSQSAPINIHTNLIGGDAHALDTIRFLEEEGLVKVDNKGQVNMTSDGRNVFDYYQRATEGFLKEVETQKNQLGTGKNTDAMATAKYFEGNQFFSSSKKTQKVTLKDLVSMGDAQRKALANDVANGRADFNELTGIVENTPFTAKMLKQTGDVEIDFGRGGESASKMFQFGEALNFKERASTKKFANEYQKSIGRELEPKDFTEAISEYKRVSSLPADNRRITYTPKEEAVSETTGTSSDKQEAPQQIKKPSIDRSPSQFVDQKSFRTLEEGDTIPKAEVIMVKDPETGKITKFTREPKFGQYRSSETSGFFPLSVIEEQVKSTKSQVTWSAARAGTKSEYRTHTSAVNQTNVIPKKLTKEQAKQEFRSEADLLNVALFGKTAEEFRLEGKAGNQRDHATKEQLQVLKQMEIDNAAMIKQGKSKSERITALNKYAISELKKLDKAQGDKAEEVSRQPRQNYWDNTQPPKKGELDFESVFGADKKNSLTEGYAKDFVKAVELGDVGKQAQALRMILGDEYDTNMQKVVNIYNKALDAIQPELKVAEGRIKSLYDRAAEFLNLKKSEPAIKTPEQNRELLNAYQYLNNKGTLEMEDGTKIPLGAEWNYDSDIHFVAGKNTVYVNQQFMTIYRAIRNGTWNNPDIGGLAEGKRGISGLFNLISDIVNDKNDYLSHPFGKFWSEVAGILSPEDKKVMKDFLEFYDNLPNKSFSLVKLDTDNVPYREFEANVRHENIHKAIIDKTGSVIKIFGDDHNVLGDIFLTPEGQTFLRGVRNSPYRSQVGDLTVMAHEIMAVGSSKDQLKLLRVGSDEEITAYSKLYVNILARIDEELGADTTKTILRYSDPEVNKLIKEALANDEYIRQNRLELDSNRFEVAKRERERRIAEGGNSPSEIASISSRSFEGSGWKNFNLRRLTRDGNPFSLTKVSGAETRGRKAEGAKPTLNFYIQRPDGTYVYENDFNSPVFKNFDTSGYFNLLDMAQDTDALQKYRDWTFPRFQKWAEEQGYHGFFNSNPDMADAFRFRVSLFDNDDTRSIITPTAVPELAVKKLGFYSAIEEALLDETVPTKAPLKTFLPIIQKAAKVSEKETNWSGFESYVKKNSNKIVSKSHILKWFEDTKSKKLEEENDIPEDSTKPVEIEKLYNTKPDKLKRDDFTTLIREGMFSAIEAEDMKSLKKDLNLMGYNYKEVTGQYTMESDGKQSKSPALLVYYPDAQASKVIQYLGNKYNQESVFHGEGGRYRLEYNDGSTRDTFLADVQNTGRETSSDGTYIDTADGKLRFSADFDWNADKTPAPQNYSLKNAQLKYEAHQKYGKDIPENAKKFIENSFPDVKVDAVQIYDQLEKSITRPVEGGYQFTEGDRYFIEPNERGELAVVSKSGKDVRDWDIDTSDDLLANGDFDAWVAVAARHIGNKGLTEPEIQRIYELSEKQDIDGLVKYVSGLNFRTPYELLANFVRVNPLVGVKNILRNTTSNSLNQVAEEIARVPSFMLDMVFAGMSEDGQRTITAPNPISIAKGLGKAATEGMHHAWTAFKKGAEDTNFEHASLFREKETRIKSLDAIGLGWAGKIVTKPLDAYTKYGFRLQNSADIPFRTFAYYRLLDETKILLAKELGVTKQKAEGYLTTEDYERAYEYSLYMAFQDRNWIADKYYGFRENLPPVAQATMDLVVPYVKTPLNVVSRVLDFSGIYPALKGLNKAFSHKDWTTLKQFAQETINNPEDRQAISYAIGRGMTGWAISYIGYKMALEGLLTGFYDREEKKERDDMGARGTGYGNIQLAGYSFDISSLSPVAFFLISGAQWVAEQKRHEEDLNKAQAEFDEAVLEDAEPEDLEKYRKAVTDKQASSPEWAATVGIMKNLALQTPIISQMVKLVDENVSRWESGKIPDVTSVLGVNRAVPAIVQETAKTLDDKERVIDTSTVKSKVRDTIKSGIPVLREELPVKYDMLGREIEAPYGLDPFKTKKIKDDPVLNEMKKAGINLGEDMKLPVLQRNEKRKEVGQRVSKVFEDTINSEIYETLPQIYRTSLLQEIKRQLTDRFDKPTEEDNHNIEVIREKYNILNILDTNPHSISKDRILTDKEALRDAAVLGIKELSFKKVLEGISNREEFLNKKFRYHLQAGQKSLTEAKQNVAEFNSDPELYIIKWYLEEESYKKSKKRLDQTKDELIRQGKTDEQIEKIKRKNAAQQRIINKRNSVPNIVMKRDTTRDRLMSGRQSENIEDRRGN